MKKIRRRFLVNPGYQLSQGGVILASHLLVALLIAGICSWFYLFVMDNGVVCNHNREFIRYLCAGALFVTMVTVFWAVRYSCSVAGMMIKLDMIMKEAGRGNLPSGSIAFRQKDHFPWLARSMNDCFAQMKQYRTDKEAVLQKISTIQKRLAGGELNVKGAAELLRQAVGEAANEETND